MKKWNEPKVWSLAFGSTSENNLTDNCGIELLPFKADGKPQHWCHNVNNGTGGWHDNGCNHPRNNKHQTNDNPDHNWDGQDQTSKCCCALS